MKNQEIVTCVQSNYSKVAAKSTHDFSSLRPHRNNSTQVSFLSGFRNCNVSSIAERFNQVLKRGKVLKKVSLKVVQVESKVSSVAECLEQVVESETEPVKKPEDVKSVATELRNRPKGRYRYIDSSAMATTLTLMDEIRT